jgi:hypothetical protein
VAGGVESALVEREPVTSSVTRATSPSRCER